MKKPNASVEPPNLYWLALDDAARAEFAAIATELGLYVLTERPTEGDLRVDHVRGEEAW